MFITYLENHVFKEMSNAICLFCFISAASIDEQTNLLEKKDIKS